MNINFLNFFLIGVFFYLSFFISKEIKFFNKILTDKEFNKPQGFHNFPTVRSGGVLIFLTTIFIFILLERTAFEITLLYIVSINFFLGFFDDTRILSNPKLRFLIFIIANLFLITFFEIKINKFDFILFDYLNNNYFLFSIFLSLCAIFFVTNGANLIDGFNGLLTIHAIIILTVLYYLANKFNLYHILTILFYILIILIFFLILNFPNAKLFLGDGGAYYIGAVISCFTIFIAREVNEVSPFFFAILIYYIFLEVIFSVFRKLYEKKDPFLPDSKHMHMLIYYIIEKKFIKNKRNYMTSIFVNIFYLMSILPSFFFYKNSLLCQFYFLFLIFLYLTSYIILRAKN
jgi:UDP-N-acetylmuramyl pentapeptide phosphotransferase/UDP-N-acetylglucosamine-1-phosphate transferase